MKKHCINIFIRCLLIKALMSPSKKTIKLVAFIIDIMTIRDFSLSLSVSALYIIYSISMYTYSYVYMYMYTR